MSDTETITLEETERDAFLGAGGIGVISLTTTAAEPPHSIPVSYGYDSSEATFYFRLSVETDSEKGALAGRPVSFVTYGRTDDRWHSVVASGQLEQTTDESIATETLQGLEQAHIPLIDIFGRPLREVTFEFYRLTPDELTGRTEPTPSPEMNTEESP
jgi:nitroimidazol reductase NimA-like FMN-containing flavoprotein (pyridoxamine 5'-phosphate oxidase superfamily)